LDKVNSLAEQILHHKAKYYQGHPEIEDHVYDQLEEELRALDENHSALQVVGSVKSGENKVAHDTKMLSLDKTYKDEDLLKWIAKEKVLSMFKIDGVSCSLIYEDGLLSMAKTRGDGQYGENITPKALWMSDIPKKIPSKEKLEVRGEIYCREESFYSLSKEMEGLGLEKPSSQRNIVAGIVSRKENIELARKLNFTAFDWITDKRLKTERIKFKNLSDNGFPVPEITFHENTKKINDVIKEAESFISEGEYLIDGLVFVYDDTNIHEELGNTAHHPKYKLAYKFKGESKVTTIKEIEWSVSRNGILTPVAITEPVELSGAQISRVTLHNLGMVREHELKTGDKIEIIRSGEVIPKFLKVIERGSGSFVIPKRGCESCVKDLEIEGIRLLCRSTFCPTKEKESILNFIQKIGIDDISSKRLDEMIKHGLVKSAADLYELRKEDLLMLDKVKEKLSEKMIQTIEKSKKSNLIVFLASLGINGGAYNKCEKVVEAGFNTLDKVLNLSEEELMEVESFAEKSSHEFVKSIKEKRPLIEKLCKLGFSFKEISQSEGVLTGKKVCITGTLSQKRSEIERKIKGAGGQIVSSVSKKTDFLLTNDQESNSSKFKKAKENLVSIITEDDLEKILNT